jgi:hypothetical protein
MKVAVITTTFLDFQAKSKGDSARYRLLKGRHTRQMWMMEMIYTRNGMAWGDHKRAFSFATFYGLAESGNTTDRWAKKRRPGAVWESWERAKRLGLGSEVGNCSTYLPVCICM